MFIFITPVCHVYSHLKKFNCSFKRLPVPTLCVAVACNPVHSEPATDAPSMIAEPSATAAVAALEGYYATVQTETQTAIEARATASPFPTTLSANVIQGWPSGRGGTARWFYAANLVAKRLSFGWEEWSGGGGCPQRRTGEHLGAAMDAAESDRSIGKPGFQIAILTGLFVEPNRFEKAEARDLGSSRAASGHANYFRIPIEFLDSIQPPTLPHAQFEE